MRQSTSAVAALTLALVGTVAAQTTVIPLLLPEFDAQPLVASVVSVGPAATTYTINCAPGTNSNDCGIGAVAPTVVAGPSTWEMHLTEGGDSA
jgi:hypothetical protein